MADAQTPDFDEHREPSPAHGGLFVPDGFEIPAPPGHARFVLEPLSPEHNDADYAAWTSSVDHIHATPGFEHGRWPHPMTLEENRGDLVMHARHFAERRGFTYTVLDPTTRDVIGCVYIYPSEDPTIDAQVRSWVRVSSAGLDDVLAVHVQDWLDVAWPFTSVSYR
ncbi:MAG: N-acetyltransferase [Actinomycetes bacterium]